MNISKEEIIIETDNTKVRIIDLEANTKAPWHHHSEVKDEFFCLEGVIEVKYRNPEKTVLLSPGQRCTVETGVIHRVTNPSNIPSRYLLVQGIGKYDFIKDDL